MTSEKTAHELEPPRRDELDRRYGKIGIPAVAAAMRYQTAARNPVHAGPDAGREQDPVGRAA